LAPKREHPLERKYQGLLIKKLKCLFPGCVILKNDSAYQQGIPDLVIFFGCRYAFLEVKASEPTSPDDYEPNQEWFIAHLNSMWFASVIYPGNEKEVLDALHDALSPSESATRFPER
jgi:hypothetical protein